MMKDRTEKLLGMLLACGAIISACVGLFYSNGGESFFVNNVYGQSVELYGDGIYAYNAVSTVSSRLGADWVGMLGAFFLIFLCADKRKSLWGEIVKTAQCTVFVYYFACLTFGISMNRLYLLYVTCFGMSVWLSIHLLLKFFKGISIKTEETTSGGKGVGGCLIICGGITVIIWVSMLIPHLVSQSYGELIGVLTTEVTFAVDLGVLCPLMIICGGWVRNKKDNGYKLAPILLYILFGVAPMVILQNLYCIKLGIEIPLPAFIGTVLSFVIMGIFSMFYFIKSMRLLELK